MLKSWRIWNTKSYRKTKKGRKSENCYRIVLFFFSFQFHSSNSDTSGIFLFTVDKRKLKRFKKMFWMFVYITCLIWNGFSNNILFYLWLIKLLAYPGPTIWVRGFFYNNLNSALSWKANFNCVSKTSPPTSHLLLWSFLRSLLSANMKNGTRTAIVGCETSHNLWETIFYTVFLLMAVVFHWKKKLWIHL